jgi:hypothetical protein
VKVVADWFDTDKLIQAAETEDEIGLVLRMHLALDKVFDHYLSSRITSELAPYIKIPKYSAQKIPLAALMGMPLPFLASARELNGIRNGLAHDDGILTKDRVGQFARQVDSIKSIDASFDPLAKRYVELSRLRPGEKQSFGVSGVRVDFLIASSVLVATMARWVVAQERVAAV